MAEITKEQIQAWLDADKSRTRKWLADQCKVAKTTVDGWLSAGRPINGPALSIIAELIGVSAPLNPSISLVTFLRAKEIADDQGISLDQWIENLMEAAISRARYPDLKVADAREAIHNVPGNESSPSTPAIGVPTKYPIGRRRKKKA